MSFLTILKILSYVAAAGVPAVMSIIGRIKLKRSHRTELKKKDGTIGQLRKAIVEMVELDGDKKDVEIQRKKIKKNVDTMSDDELSIAYANQLPNMPAKRKRTRKKS